MGVTSWEMMGMLYSVGDLREALRGIPDEALLSLDVSLQGTDALVGKALVNSVSVSGPDGLGFRRCRIGAELPFADMVASKALGHVPSFALEEVLATGKAPTAEGIEEGLYEL